MHIVIRPGEVWCWDVMFLPAQIQGRWFYLYLIRNLYIRRQAKPLPRSVVAKALSDW